MVLTSGGLIPSAIDKSNECNSTCSGVAVFNHAAETNTMTVTAMQEKNSLIANFNYEAAEMSGLKLNFNKVTEFFSTAA
jgi:hypothetical protein